MFSRTQSSLYEKQYIIIQGEKSENNTQCAKDSKESKEIQWYINFNLKYCKTNILIYLAVVFNKKFIMYFPAVIV